MSALFLKRFLSNPFKVASIVPSSKTLVRRVSDKMDFSVPRVIAEYGPGEGCHTREFVRRMHPDSRLLLFELDTDLCKHLEKQFANDSRISVHNTDCAKLPEVLSDKGLKHCDYIVSVTNELRTRGHCDHFAHAESEYCLVNLPPMFVTKFYKANNGHAVNGKNGKNGHSLNGNGGNGAH
jgi:hypothetical protein